MVEPFNYDSAKAHVTFARCVGILLFFFNYGVLEVWWHRRNRLHACSKMGSLGDTVKIEQGEGTYPPQSYSILMFFEELQKLLIIVSSIETKALNGLDQRDHSAFLRVTL